MSYRPNHHCTGNPPRVYSLEELYSLMRDSSSELAFQFSLFSSHPYTSYSFMLNTGLSSAEADLLSHPCSDLILSTRYSSAMLHLANTLSPGDDVLSSLSRLAIYQVFFSRLIDRPYRAQSHVHLIIPKRKDALKGINACEAYSFLLESDAAAFCVVTDLLSGRVPVLYPSETPDGEDISYLQVPVLTGGICTIRLHTHVSDIPDTRDWVRRDVLQDECTPFTEPLSDADLYPEHSGMIIPVLNVGENNISSYSHSPFNVGISAILPCLFNSPLPAGVRIFMSPDGKRHIPVYHGRR